MKKAMLLGALAVLAAPRAALSLTDGVARTVRVAGQPAGVVTPFFLGNSGGPAGSCQYYIDWQSPLGEQGGSVPCVVNEQKVLGHTSCFSNAKAAFTTIVTSLPKQCSGYDQFGAPQLVSLMLAESDVGPTLIGLGLFQLFPFLPRPISTSAAHRVHS